LSLFPQVVPTLLQDRLVQGHPGSDVLRPKYFEAWT
jgi:hypothetical protein